MIVRSTRKTKQKIHLSSFIHQSNTVCRVNPLKTIETGAVV